MPDPLQRPCALHFDVFQMDLDSEELTKNGVKLKLRCQPFRMLATIAEHNGKVVTYETLRTQFWPRESIDNYKHSLGNSMLEIRKVLDDCAKNPRYIKTVPRGYRFLAPVKFIPPTNGNGSSHSPAAGLLIEIRGARQELITTLDCRRLALLFFRCDRLRNQYLLDPNLPELQILMADIQSAIDRSKVFEPAWANPTISDEVASLVFDDPNAISVPHRFRNGRWKTIGQASEFVLLVVEHSVRPEDGQHVLIHGARRATPEERRFYEQAQK